MCKNCSVVVIMNQLGITWYAGASIGVLVVCLLLMAEGLARHAFGAASTSLTFFYWTYISIQWTITGDRLVDYLSN